MKPILLAIVISTALMVGCRRTEGPSAASVSDVDITDRLENFADKKTTMTPVELPHVDHGGTEEPFFSDPAIVCFEEEIAAYDREIKALELKFSEQEGLVRELSSILTKESEIPHGVLKLFNDRHETITRIKALEELRRNSIKVEEQRRKNSIEK